MKILKLSEYGYKEAALGFSLSYNTSIERAKELLPRYANGIPGENKFLESIIFYLDVTAPRFWWQEADTYRIGSTKNSESSMHTLTKHELTKDNFEYTLPPTTISNLNQVIAWYNSSVGPEKNTAFLMLKSALPEGFLQRRIWCLNYKTFKNIYLQRLNHRLDLWGNFCKTVLSELDHPEFI